MKEWVLKGVGVKKTEEKNTYEEAKHRILQLECPKVSCYSTMSIVKNYLGRFLLDLIEISISYWKDFEDVRVEDDAKSVIFTFI